MSFKSYILKLLGRETPRALHGLSDLQPSTPLARFILDRKHLRKTEPRVRPKSFLPREDPGIGEMALSTFRVDGLQEEMIWEIGQNEIASKAGRSLKGRCDLPTQVYTTCGLTADFDNQPLRHVNIVGWPQEEEKRLAIAQELAAAVAEQGTFFSLID